LFIIIIIINIITNSVEIIVKLSKIAHIFRLIYGYPGSVLCRVLTHLLAHQKNAFFYYLSGM